VTAPSLEDVDWDALSPEGRWILRNVAWPVRERDSYKAVARRLDVQERAVSRPLDELADEIRSQLDRSPDPP